MEADRDVLVLGGGPAGAATALLARRAGLSVTLLERARFPRDKVCGEFVSPEGCGVLDRLGVLPALLDAGATWMGACRITDRRGRPLDVPLPKLAAGQAALGISRERMDTVLLNAVRAAGADVRERTEATAPLLRDGRVAGVMARPVGHDREVSLPATVVVGADGRRSMLVRRFHATLGDPRTSGPRSWFGLKVHLTGHARPLERVELHLFDGGYAGLGAIEDDRLNLCLMVRVAALRACGGSPQRLLEERLLANPALAAAVGEARPCRPWKSVGPLRFAPRRATARGALLVGDAAGTIDPYSGEGISHALLAAELALPVVQRAVERGGVTASLASGYQRDWNLAFAPVSRRVRRLGRLLERPALAGVALRLLRGPARPLAPRLVGSTRTGS